MTPSTVQLWERIHAAGLATPEECRQWAISVAQAGGAEALHDSPRLAAELIKLGKLTSFQANVLFRELSIPLHLGTYRVMQSLELELGPNWYQATDLQRKAGASPSWLHLLSAETLARPALRANPPSLELASKHAAVTHPSLDQWTLATVDADHVVAVCESLGGQSLAAKLADSELSWSESATMIEQIAAGLQRLHDAGLVHGSISAHSVWCLEDGIYALRRDPLFPATNPYVQAGYSVLGNDFASRLASAAPELTLPGAALSPATDLYALGCLWYQTLLRRPMLVLAPNADTNKWAQAHATKQPPELTDTGMPSSLQRCLSHLVAKNPSARFASATALMRAIEYALSHAEPEPTPVRESTPRVPVETTSSSPVPSTPSSSPTRPKDENVSPVKPVANPLLKPKPAPKSAEESLVVNQAASSAPQSAAKSTERPTISAPIAESPKPAETPKPTVKPPAEKVQAVPAAPTSSVPAPVAPILPAKAPSDAQSTQPSPSIEASPVAAAPAEAPKPKKKKKSTTGKKGKKKKASKKKPVWLFPLIVGSACLILALLVGILMQSNRTRVVDNKQRTNDTVKGNANANDANAANQNTPAPTTKPTTKPADQLSDYYTVVVDDGASLWAPPFAGEKNTTELLPAGFEAIAFLSKSAWTQTGNLANASKWWLASQPELINQIAAYPILRDPRIASVAIALYPSKQPGVPQAVFRLTMSEPVTIESVLKSNPGFAVQLFDAKGDSKRGLWSNDANTDPTALAFQGLQVDEAATVKHISVGPQTALMPLNETDGLAAPMRRQFETLLQSSDSRADFTVLAAPSFLFGNARELFSRQSNLYDVLRSSIDETMQAVQLSTSSQSQWYVELRMLSSETKDAGKFASQLKQQLQKAPDELESGMNKNPVHPYWRALAGRYPQMLRSLNKFGRFGIEDGQVVANVYLPVQAIDNVLISSWMALQNLKADSTPMNNGSRATPAATAQKSIEEILDSKVNISFAQESLESALQLIATEVSDSLLSGKPVNMAINGTAFQKEGITRNQQIRDFAKSGVPLRDILMDLVRRANPVTTVKEPTEKDQKVVWIILDDPESPLKKKIELTTRRWVEENKATLPKEFVGN